MAGKMSKLQSPYRGADDNRWAGLIQIRCGQSVFLLGGDATGSSQEYWTVNETVPHSYPGARAALAETGVYKVHHHGSKYSSYPDFVDLMAPAYAVAQMAYGSGPGSNSHPTREALDRIWSAGGIVYRNDLDGTVLIKCDSRGNYEITRSRSYRDEAATPGGSNDQVHPPPPLPADLRVGGWGENYISLVWEEIPGVWGYDVFRSTVSGGDGGAGRDANPGVEPTGIYEKITAHPVAFAGYTDTGTAPGVVYYYRVSSLEIHTEGGYQVAYESRYSNQAAAAAGGSSRTPTPPGWKTPPPSVTPQPSPVVPTPAPSPSAPPPVPRGPVIINEILADVPLGAAGDANGDGFRSSWEDEFVELVNWTGYTVNLGGSSLSDSTAIRFTFDHPFYLAPGQAVVVFGGGSPTGAFGGAGLAVVGGLNYGLSLSNGGDTVTLHNGEFIYDSYTYGPEGGGDRSLSRSPELSGGFVPHDLFPTGEGKFYSPGTRVNGEPFIYQPTPTPPPSPPPTPIATPSPTPTASAAPSATVTPTPTSSPSVSPTATPQPSASPSVSPAPSASPSPSCFPRWIRDYDGDGTSDIALFRPAVGFWVIRGISRFYFGREGDEPIPADYSGDGTTTAAVFRSDTGLWAMRGVTRVYFGRPDDRPVPADYSGDGTTQAAVFRSDTGLWVVRDLTRFYFGGAGDLPLPGYYAGPAARPAVFRPSSGLWALRELSRVYFGAPGDIPAPGDYAGGEDWLPAIFRPDTGLWTARSATRIYFGRPDDFPLAGRFGGTAADGAAIFRPSSGLWVLRSVTRVYFGRFSDIPVVR